MSDHGWGHAVGDGWDLVLHDLDPGTGGGDGEPGEWPGDPGDLTPAEPPPWYEPPPPPPAWAGPVDEEVAVAIYEWVTQGDGRVCPVCGPLDGSRWEDDDGPFPPLHVGCRCQRVLAGIEWRTARREAALWGRVAGDSGARLWPR